MKFSYMSILTLPSVLNNSFFCRYAVKITSNLLKRKILIIGLLALTGAALYVSYYAIFGYDRFKAKQVKNSAVKGKDAHNQRQRISPIRVNRSPNVSSKKPVDAVREHNSEPLSPKLGQRSLVEDKPCEELIHSRFNNRLLRCSSPITPNILVQPQGMALTSAGSSEGGNLTHHLVTDLKGTVLTRMNVRDGELSPLKAIRLTRIDFRGCKTLAKHGLTRVKDKVVIAINFSHAWNLMTPLFAAIDQAESTKQSSQRKRLSHTEGKSPLLIRHKVNPENSLVDPIEESEEVGEKVTEALDFLLLNQDRLENHLSSRDILSSVGVKAEEVVQRFWLEKQAKTVLGKQKNKGTMFWGINGNGPSFPGQAYSVANTLQKMVQDVMTFRSLSILAGLKDDSIKNAVNILSSKGKQLNNVVFEIFFNLLTKRNPKIQVIRHFYQRSLEDFSKEEILQILEDNKTRAFPICIPLTLGHHELFERKHMTVIIVTEEGIQFYDPKGVMSHHHVLKDNKGDSSLLREILLACEDIFLKKRGYQGGIKENKRIHQYDAHRCGLFVLFFVFSVLEENKTMDDFEEAMIFPSLLAEFREALIIDFQNYDQLLSQETVDKGSTQEPFDIEIDYDQLLHEETQAKEEIFDLEMDTDDDLWLSVSSSRNEL